jgi:hypothetical protein
MTFKPSVLGGERRGEWGVKRGQNAAPFPTEKGSSGRRRCPVGPPEEGDGRSS